MGDLGRGARPDRENAAEQIGDRAVRAVRVVGGASRSRDARTERSWIREQLVHQTCLAEASLADDRDDVASSGQRLVERAHELGDLGVATDERRTGAVGHGGFDSQEPPRYERRAFALSGDGRVRLVCEESRCEPVRRIADENLTRLRCLLESRSDIDRIAEHAELALFVADRARDGESGVDPDPQREVSARPFGDAFVFAVERAEDGEPGALRARRMIDLVVARSEDRDDRVADVLLDQAPRRADLGRDAIPRRAHVLVELFGTEPFRERGKPGDIGEEDRDLPRLAADRLNRDETRAASSAEAECHGHLGRALRTRDQCSPHRSREVTSAKCLLGCRRGVLARHPFR